MANCTFCEVGWRLGTCAVVVGTQKVVGRYPGRRPGTGQCARIPARQGLMSTTLAIARACRLPSSSSAATGFCSRSITRRSSLRAEALSRLRRSARPEFRPDDNPRGSPGSRVQVGDALSRFFAGVGPDQSQSVIGPIAGVIWLAAHGFGSHAVLCANQRPFVR